MNIKNYDLCNWRLKHYLYKILLMKSKVKIMRCKEIIQIYSKNLFKHHMLNKSFKFIIKYIISTLLSW